MNRQQVNKYLSGQTTPSLSTLRRICDFFGVDEAEILMNSREFADLVRLRPPKLGLDRDPFGVTVDHLFGRNADDTGLLDRHAGYYHVHFRPDPGQDYILRTLCRIYSAGDHWLTKSVERHDKGDFTVPSPLKFDGIATEAHNRIIVQERERGRGRSFWTTMLIATEYATPSYLVGLVIGIAPEGSHELTATRTVWRYLGRSPNLRDALATCGVIRDGDSGHDDFVHRTGLAQKGVAGTLTVSD